MAKKITMKILAIILLLFSIIALQNTVQAKNGFQVFHKEETKRIDKNTHRLLPYTLPR